MKAAGSPAGSRTSTSSSIRQRKGRRRWAMRRTILESTITDGVGLYWRYEKQIRRDESATGSVVGATGAIYAMRRSLWQPLPDDTILDDVLTPMRCVMAGYRVVFEERACAFDRTAPDANTEGRRKLRTLAGNYQLLWLEPRLLLPWCNPAWLQFVSHKVGRLPAVHDRHAASPTSSIPGADVGAHRGDLCASRHRADAAASFRASTARLPHHTRNNRTGRARRDHYCDGAVLRVARRSHRGL